ncbi:MAG: DNA primase, partial [Bacteroidales bacterium]
MIPPQTVQQILETARIDEVVADYVNLRKRGSNLLGLCPFHQEKTPSFMVSPAKGIFKCFGCGKGGDSLTFIMEHEHYTYPEALRYLAQKYNIEIVEEEKTSEQIQKLNDREALFHLSDFAAHYFSKLLFEHSQGRSIGLSYFREREFTDASIEKFQLGYCLDQWDAFTKAALKQTYQKQYLVQTGLSIEKDDKLFDRFKGRVIFPIHNLSGRVIGFGGRILGADKNKSKYVNSPESEIYNKSQALYGIFFAKKSIIQKDQCLLVEGYTDVISLHQAG